MELTNRRKWLRSLAFGLVWGVAAVGLVRFVSYFAKRPEWGHLEVFVGAGSLVAGCLVWRLVVALDGIYSLKRGAVAGAIAWFLSYYVSWYLFYLYGFFWWLADLIRGVETISDPVTPITGVWGAAIMTFTAIAFLGWKTIGTGIVVGMIVVFVQGRLGKPALVSE